MRIEGRTMWITIGIGVAAILIIIFIGYKLTFSNNKYEKLLMQSQQKDARIITLEKQLTDSEDRRQKLLDRVALKIAEAKNIKQPKDIQEIKDRLNKLGYKVR